jgi:hypothetical protein
MHLAGLEMEMMDLDVTLPGTSAASSTRHTHQPPASNGGAEEVVVVVVVRVRVRVAVAENKAGTRWNTYKAQRTTKSEEIVACRLRALLNGANSTKSRVFETRCGWDIKQMYRLSEIPR